MGLGQALGRIAAALVLAVVATGSVAAQEAKEIRISKQFGISYLPLTLMEALQLVEKQAKAAGLGEVKASWMQLTGGAPTNDALISGNLDVAGGGVGPMLTIWARTRGNIGVRAIASLNSMPLYLVSNNPKVKTIKDLTEADRIGMPAVKISIQAVTLQMAAEQMFGAGHSGDLDKLTVSMGHPDALAALMAGRSEITGHFGSPPFQEQELLDPRMTKVLNSYDVLGGPATFNLVWATDKFHKENPKLFAAFLAALEEAMSFINANRSEAAKLWIKAENSKLPQDFVEKVLANPEYVFTTAPQNVMKYAEFMHRTGAIKEKPASWKDLFFDDLHGKQGS